MPLIVAHLSMFQFQFGQELNTKVAFNTMYEILCEHYHRRRIKWKQGGAARSAEFIFQITVEKFCHQDNSIYEQRRHFEYD